MWNDFPTEVANINGEGRWYPMFELAVHYLLDVNGLNKSIIDVKNIFIDMDVNNHSFADAFEIYMGISLQSYEDNFWRLMENYLH